MIGLLALLLSAQAAQAVSIIIDKSDRSLELRRGAEVLARYPVALGDPLGDKVREGDRKTPEGRFVVVTRNDRSQFHRFLGLSYPNAEDAARGLRDGLIGASEARRIEEAIAAGRQPSWSTALGGAVGIHGGGTGSDWTLGCIALDNVHIDALWPLVPIGTVVLIQE